MPLSRLLRDLDSLTTEEKLRAIQYLSSSLIRNNNQVPKSDAKPGSILQDEGRQDHIKAEPRSELPTPDLEASQSNASKKKAGVKKKNLIPDQISEMSPDGNLYFVNLPNLEMLHDLAEEIWDTLSETQDPPTVSKHEFAYDCAAFLRAMFRIQASAAIRRAIKGTEDSAQPSEKTKTRKRKKVEKPEQKMIITHVGGGRYHVDYVDIAGPDTLVDNVSSGHNSA